jgi:hypothetical protein
VKSRRRPAWLTHRDAAGGSRCSAARRRWRAPAPAAARSAAVPTRCRPRGRGARSAGWRTSRCQRGANRTPATRLWCSLGGLAGAACRRRRLPAVAHSSSRHAAEAAVHSPRRASTRTLRVRTSDTADLVWWRPPPVWRRDAGHDRADGAPASRGAGQRSTPSAAEGHRPPSGWWCRPAQRARHCRTPGKTGYPRRGTVRTQDSGQRSSHPASAAPVPGRHPSPVRHEGALRGTPGPDRASSKAAAGVVSPSARPSGRIGRGARPCPDFDRATVRIPPSHRRTAGWWAPPVPDPLAVGIVGRRAGIQVIPFSSGAPVRRAGRSAAEKAPTDRQPRGQKECSPRRSPASTRWPKHHRAGWPRRRGRGGLPSSPPDARCGGLADVHAPASAVPASWRVHNCGERTSEPAWPFPVSPGRSGAVPDRPADVRRGEQRSTWMRRREPTRVREPPGVTTVRKLPGVTTVRELPGVAPARDTTGRPTGLQAPPPTPARLRRRPRSLSSTFYLTVRRSVPVRLATWWRHRRLASVR